MAMPPDGSSAWVKHDDVYVLTDGADVFASLVVPVSGRGASVTMPFLDSATDSFYVLRLDGDASELSVTIDGCEPFRWRDLSARDVPITERRRHGPATDLPIRGQLRVSGDGLVIVDASGRVRLSASRTSSDAQAIAVCGSALFFTIARCEGCGVQKQASSMP